MLNARVASIALIVSLTSCSGARAPTEASSSVGPTAGQSSAVGAVRAEYEVHEWGLVRQEAPGDVVKLALRATASIGDGLYGVDLKQVNDKPVLIEVNDNPSIDAGIEDAYLGEDLYRRIMEEFLRRMERKRLGIES